MDIKIIVNNKEISISEETTIQQLLDRGEYGKRVAVWVNKTQLLKSQYPSQILHDGDVVKILRLVGGG